MTKQLVIFLILSILVVIFAHYIQLIIVYIDLIYNAVNSHLHSVFSQSALGQTIRKIMLLLLIPLITVAVPAVPYRFIKGRPMPYLLETTWCLWFVIFLSETLIH